MVQVLPASRYKSNQESLSESFFGAFGEAAKNEILQRQARAKELADFEEENKRFEEVYGPGKKLAGLSPEMRRAELGLMLASEKKIKTPEELKIEELDFNVMTDRFGKKFAEMWRASDPGARNELTKIAMDYTARGGNVNDLFEQVEEVEKPDTFVPQGKEKVEVGINERKLPETYKKQDFTKIPKGYTPKEWNIQRNVWRKENAPLFNENHKSLQASRDDQRDIKNLNRLNQTKKLPDDFFQRLILNPETGEPYGIAQIAKIVEPEAQEWIKTIARFQNRAKDAFGSRVTNFDLMSYMKQFPSLMNTYEGRQRIIDMIGINNELDQLYENALDLIYKKYGLDGIPQEKAQEEAERLIEDKAIELNDKYLNLREQDVIEEKQPETKLSGKMVDVIGPDGKLYEIDESEIDQLPPEYRLKNARSK